MPDVPGPASSRRIAVTCSGGRQQDVLAGGRAKAVGAAGEVAVGERSRRDVSGVAEAGIAGQREHLLRRVEADERGAGGAGAAGAGLEARARSASSRSSTGSRNVIASVEPGASAASWRSVAAVASLVRYMLTPVDATTAGRSGSKPAAANPSHQLSPVSKSIGTNRSQSGTPKPTSTRRRRFHAWVPGWSTSKIRRRAPSSGRRWARVSRPAPRMTYWVTPAAACSTTRSSMKRARATMEARNPRVPSGCMSRPVAPVAVGCGQLQADDVLEHVRRRVDLDVHRPPERDPDRGAVRFVGFLDRHDALAAPAGWRAPGGYSRGGKGRGRSWSCQEISSADLGHRRLVGRLVGVGMGLRLSCSVEEEAEEDVGEPVLEAFERPAGVSDEP